MAIRALREAEAHLATELARAAGATLTLTGYRFTADNFAIRHVLKAHGVAARELPRGQLPILRVFGTSC